MILANLLLLATLSLTALSQKITSDEDVPTLCGPACAGVIEVGRRCNDFLDTDRNVLECMCNTWGMPTEVPKCEACIVNNWSPNENVEDSEYDDVKKLSNVCGFSKLVTSPSGSAAAAGASATALGHHLSNVNGVAGKAIPVAGAAAGIMAAVTVAL